MFIQLVIPATQQPWRFPMFPSRGVDARAWPKSPMSKILTVAMCVRHGFDVLWLDTDTAVAPAAAKQG